MSTSTEKDGGHSTCFLFLYVAFLTLLKCLHYVYTAIPLRSQGDHWRRHSVDTNPYKRAYLAEGSKYLTSGFCESVLQSMHSFFLEGQFCDFKVKVEGKTFQIHKLVFASSSDYFKAMLSHDMIETRDECTELKGITLKGFEPILTYIYKGCLAVDIKNIQDVMAAATFLQIPGAIDLCTKFLKEELTFENAYDLLKIGEMFAISSLRDYYRNYLLKNFLKFVESETFLKTDSETLANYLSDDALVTTSESVLFHHCMRWYEHDMKNREPVAHSVFEKVRLSSDGWPLIHFAKEQDLFKTDKKCQELIEFHEQFMEKATKRYFLSDNDRTRVRSSRRTIIQIGGVMEPDENYDSFHDMITQPVNSLCGWNMNHYFHPDLKSWFPLGGLSNWIQRLSHQKFVEVNGHGLMIGGYEYHIADDTANKIAISDVRMFSPQHNFQFWDMPSLQHPRARHAAVYLNGFIYAIAGRDDKQVLKSVERLDCEAETWSYVRALPRKLYDHAAAVCEGKIYVSGGIHSIDGDAVKTVWCYDPAKNNWNKRQNLNCARAGHGMVCLEGHLYVCGGYNGQRDVSHNSGNLRCLVSVEMYDVKTNVWTKLTTMRQGIAFFEITVLDGRILVMGGVDTAGRLTQYMHEFNATKNKWTVFGELPRPLKNASCGAVVIKLTDTGCMEDETDEFVQRYTEMFDDHQLAHMSEQERLDRELAMRMMENFDPGDYLLDDDEDEDYDDEYGDMYYGDIGCVDDFGDLGVQLNDDEDED